MRDMRQEKKLKINGFKFPKYGENHTLTDQSSVNPNQGKTTKITTRYIIVKLLKNQDKQKIWKAVRIKEQITYRITVVEYMNDDWFFIKMETRGQWNNIFKLLQKNPQYYQLRILCNIGGKTHPMVTSDQYMSLYNPFLNVGSTCDLLQQFYPRFLPKRNKNIYQ